MKLTQEDIQKYGTEDEKKILKEVHWPTSNKVDANVIDFFENDFLPRLKSYFETAKQNGIIDQNILGTCYDLEDILIKQIKW